MLTQESKNSVYFIGGLNPTDCQVTVYRGPPDLLKDERGGKSPFGKYRHGQPVRRRYKIAFMAERMSVLRGRPPGLDAGISGDNRAHSSSVRSLGYRALVRLWVSR